MLGSEPEGRWSAWTPPFLFPSSHLLALIVSRVVMKWGMRKALGAQRGGVPLPGAAWFFSFLFLRPFFMPEMPTSRGVGEAR